MIVRGESGGGKLPDDAFGECLHVLLLIRIVVIALPRQGGVGVG